MTKALTGLEIEMADIADHVSVAILAPSDEEIAAIRTAVRSIERARVVAESSSYPTDEGPGALSTLEAANPGIFLVEVSGIARTMETIRNLHTAFPEAWVLVVSEGTDPQIIIQSVRAGAREFLPKPLTPEALSEAFGRYLLERTRQAARQRGQVYWVTSAKGGSGTTSVAINLAKSISGLESTKVALFDLNRPVGDAATYLNLRPEFTVANALAAGERLDPVLLESYLSSTQGISVLSGTKEFHPAEQLEPRAVRKLLQVSSSAYSHTLVDLPSFLPRELLLSLAKLSDRILVILTPELPALWMTHRLLHFLEAGDCQQKLYMILNRFEKNAEITKAEIEKTLEQPIGWTLPNDYRSAIQAINSGQPLVSLNHSPLAASYDLLAQKLTGMEAPRRRRGILGGLFK